jgi:hypothetical protein
MPYPDSSYPPDICIAQSEDHPHPCPCRYPVLASIEKKYDKFPVHMPSQTDGYMVFLRRIEEHPLKHRRVR